MQRARNGLHAGQRYAGAVLLSSESGDAYIDLALTRMAQGEIGVIPSQELERLSDSFRLSGADRSGRVFSISLGPVHQNLMAVGLDSAKLLAFVNRVKEDGMNMHLLQQFRAAGIESCCAAENMLAKRELMSSFPGLGAAALIERAQQPGAMPSELKM